MAEFGQTDSNASRALDAAVRRLHLQWDTIECEVLRERLRGVMYRGHPSLRQILVILVERLSESSSADARLEGAYLLEHAAEAIRNSSGQMAPSDLA